MSKSITLFVFCLENNIGAMFDRVVEKKETSQVLRFKIFDEDKTLKYMDILAKMFNLELEIIKRTNTIVLTIDVEVTPCKKKDIVVTLPKNRGGVKHLQDKISALEEHGMSISWEFKGIPNALDVGSRLYIVSEGLLHGYFRVSVINYDSNTVKLDYWGALPKPILYDSFRGFRYMQRATNKRQLKKQIKDIESSNIST